MSGGASGGKNSPPAWWYGGAIPWHARVLAALYGWAIAFRSRMFAAGVLRMRRVDKPVLIIGNLIAGGSGKTPLVIAMVERLRHAGWIPGVATRGYGRSDANTALWVDAATDPVIGGDEPVLIARRTGAKVRADVDRVAAARALIDAGCDIVVCDDGLQHYRLQRDVEIEVIDGRRGYGNGMLLPAGPLREPQARSARCDFRVRNLGAGDEDASGDGISATTAEASHAAGFGEWPMRLAMTQANPLLGGRPLPLASLAGQRVHAVAGIGNPERFFASLRALDIAVVPHAFADHHRYQAQDLQFGSDLPILMTEKDAVKCVAFANARHYAVPVSAELPEAFWVALLARLAPMRNAETRRMNDIDDKGATP